MEDEGKTSARGEYREDVEYGRVTERFLGEVRRVVYGTRAVWWRRGGDVSLWPPTAASMTDVWEGEK